MYKPTDKTQTSFHDFNQPMGLHMNPDNRWVRMAESIPWDLFEVKYVGLFPSDTGNVAKPLRMALGSLIIQNRFLYSDRELVEQITADMLCEANEYLLAYKDDDMPEPPTPGDGTDESSASKKEEANKGTLDIDATCAPSNIRYPQDISLLNEARENWNI